MSPWKQFWLDLFRRVCPIVIDGLTTVVAILCMGLVHRAFEFVFGHDATFLGRFPVRYWIDAADISLLTGFVVNVWRKPR